MVARINGGFTDGTRWAAFRMWISAVSWLPLNSSAFPRSKTLPASSSLTLAWSAMESADPAEPSVDFL